MTFPPSDSPDWTGIPGALRYLGSINASGNGAIAQVLAFSPASYDAAIYVIPTGNPSSATFLADISLVKLGAPNLTFGDEFYYVNGLYAPHPFVGFTAAVLGSSWQVQAAIDGAVGSTWQLHCFAAPVYPLQRVAGLDPRIEGTDQIPFVRPIWIPRRAAYDSMLNHAPAAATRATVTFPATVNKRWILDFANWSLSSTAAVASAVTARVVDGAAILFQDQVSIPATANVIDRVSIPANAGFAGSFGTALVVDFALAGPANTIERVAAGAYLSEV